MNSFGRLTKKAVRSRSENVHSPPYWPSEFGSTKNCYKMKKDGTGTAVHCPYHLCALVRGTMVMKKGGPKPSLSKDLQV